MISCDREEKRRIHARLTSGYALRAWAVCGVMLGLLGCREIRSASSDVHPHFGPVIRCEAADANAMRDTAERKLCEWLIEHVPLAGWVLPLPPRTLVGSPTYLQLDADTQVQLEWSVREPLKKTGWMHCRPPSAGQNDARWQFARCPRTDFQALTPADLPDVWSDTGIGVREGDIVFARRSSQPERVWILKLSHQRGHRLQVAAACYHM